jgi:hypothetical protein
MTLGPTLAGGCLSLGYDCPEDQCRDGEVRCVGNDAQACILIAGDPCYHMRWGSNVCPAGEQACWKGECVLKDDSCPAATKSVCRGTQMHECVDGRVAARHGDCANTTRACVTLTSPNGEAFAECGAQL